MQLRDSWFPIYVQEQGHEVSGHKYVFDPLLGWRNIPNWTAATLGHPLTINSKGLRDVEYDWRKPEGTARVLVLGDSYTWGYGVGDGEMFAERLEVGLQESGRTVQVLNAGVSGWGTDQQYLFFREEGHRYEPDVVVVAFYYNDTVEVSRSRIYALSKPVFLNTDLELANVPVPKPGDVSKPITPQADTYDLLGSIIRRLSELCTRHGARLVVMKFGSFLAPDDPNGIRIEAELESRLELLTDVAYLDLDEEFATRGLTARELVGENRDGHWDAYGHQQTAAILQQFLIDRGLLD